MSEPQATLRPTRKDDEARFAALEAYGILDTAAEPGFDDLTTLASQVCDAPIALVSLVDRDRQWFKARVGFPACETDLDSSICKFVLAKPDFLVIPDLTQDPRTSANPLVTGEPFIRFYAGAPLRTPGGVTVGSLCVIDTVPRPAGLTANQRAALHTLARQVVTLLELRQASAAQARTAERLRENEARQTGALAIARLGTYEWDLATGVVAMDGRSREIFGFLDGEGTTAREVFDRIHPDDFPGVHADAMAAAAAGALLEREYRIRLPGGEGRVVSSRGEFLSGADGRPGRAVGVFADITDRVRSEATLRESEARFRNMADHAPVIMWVTDPSGYCTYLNPRWYELTGQSPAEAEGFGWLDAAHPDDKAEAERAFVDANARGAAFRVEYRLRGADGTYRWAVDAASPRFGPDGAFLGYVGSVTDIDAQKRAQESLRGANETLEAQVAERTAERDRIWRNSGDLLGIADGRGVWLSVNPAWSRMLGWRPDEIVGRTSEWLEHPEDRARTRAEVKSLSEGQSTLSFENRFRTRSGGYRTLSWSAVPENGLLYCVARDVTETRAQAEILAEQNASRERTWRYTPDLLCVIDMPSAAFDRVNPAWTASLGWSKGQLEGSPYEEFVHPDDLAASREAWEVARAGNPVFRFENRYRTADGRWRWFSWVAFPEGDKLYASVRDVTDAHEQAARLLTATNERERAWGLAQELLVTARPDGTIETVNPMWTQLLGWETDEIVGRPFVEFTHPDDMEGALAAFAGIFERPLVIPFEYRFRHEDGTYRWFAWTGTYADGRIYASGRSTTLEREQAEALRQSQKMEAVGQLTGGLAHDFNNLLAGISGSLELMQTRMQQGRFNDVERYMAAAQGASKRAAALTHRLLAFSRRQTLAPRPTDVNRLAAGMQEMIQRTVGPGIPVEVVGASGAWPALVDPSQLENALLNLCINARDAMPGGGRITVETANKWMDERASRKHDMPEGQYLSLCVTDTGTGMTPEVVARVFEPFFTTKPIGEGTGLGLSMVYGFAQQSGGQVRIYSEVGQGTTVCIYLPRHYGETADDEVRGPVVDLPRSEQGETVLIVDDEPTVRMLVTDILDDLGYTAIEAGDSVAGLKVLQSDVRIDLLVTDVGLPGGMNGRQMADAARAARPDLKVLFITGYAENAILGNGTLPPGMAVLTKPFAMDSMAARIRSMIEAARTRG